MRGRCLNTKHKDYADYGGRGVTVCDRWKTFDNFIADMGPAPANATVERIDNNGNYEPKNCRWATRAEQGRNKRNNRFLTYDGKTQHLTAWARDLGIAHSTLRERLERGWPVEKALSKRV